jgi:hypothetical protein
LFFVFLVFYLGQIWGKAESEKQKTKVNSFRALGETLTSSQFH